MQGSTRLLNLCEQRHVWGVGSVCGTPTSKTPANLCIQVVRSWLDWHLPAWPPKYLPVGGSLHKYMQRVGFVQVPTISSQNTTTFKLTSEGWLFSQERPLPGWQSISCCDCWSLLTFAAHRFCLILLCILAQSGTASTCTRWQCIWPDVLCACPTPWQPPCLGEWKDFSNVVCKLLMHRLWFCCPSSFHLLLYSQHQLPGSFSHSYQPCLSCLFSGSVPCKRWTYTDEAKAVQYLLKTEAYVAKGLCNFPCLSCLSLTRTKHSSNFFWNKPLWLRESITSS